MTDYKTPGVYVEEVPGLQASIAQVETAIPAFIGYTQVALDGNNTSLINHPTRITSLPEYETFFGKAVNEDNLEIKLVQEQTGSVITKETVSVAFNGAPSKHIMYYALRAYFANGGGPCYIVSVGLIKPEPGSALCLREMDEGLQALAKEEEPTLIVFPEGQQMEESDYYSLQNKALAQCDLLQNRFCIMDLHHTGEGLQTSGEVSAAAESFRDGITHHLKYGAAYFPNIKTVFPYLHNENAINIVHTVNGSAGSLNGSVLADFNNSSHAAYNAFAYRKLKTAIEEFGVILPPSAAIAGIYAAVDANRGVWKSPANVAVNGLRGLTYKITNNEQDFLNVDAVSGKSINCLRAFTGKGILVWGARTLAGNDNEWRYVSVRRFFNVVEESCKKASAPFVFEPNDANTWVKVKAMIENYLILLWRQGALAGAKPEHAFFVACGLNQTMTALDILEGKMIVEIGMAAVRPAEFIILRFFHNMQES